MPAVTSPWKYVTLYSLNTGLPVHRLRRLPTLIGQGCLGQTRIGLLMYVAQSASQEEETSRNLGRARNLDFLGW